jgi:hypothetical protein
VTRIFQKSLSHLRRTVFASSAKPVIPSASSQRGDEFCNVPGLEVCRGVKDNLRFVCPEILVYNANLFQEAEDSCSSLVCIMAGDQLAPLLGTAGRTEEVVNQVEAEGMDGLGMSEFPKACLHRVRTPLKRARLSISYELRL